MLRIGEDDDEEEEDTAPQNTAWAVGFALALEHADVFCLEARASVLIRTHWHLGCCTEAAMSSALH